MADHLETERKYEADPGFSMPPLTGLPGVARVDEPHTYLLAATYYDTPDLTLLASHRTLRRRTGGPDEGWHLKLPAGQDTRREMREPLGGEQVPPRLAAAIGELPVAPVAVLDSQRTVRHLYDQAGRLQAEVADDLVTGRRLAPGAPGAPGADAPVSWREIEIETDNRDLLDAAGRLLLEAGARRATSSSKVARVLRPRNAVSRPPGSAA